MCTCIYLVRRVIGSGQGAEGGTERGRVGCYLHLVIRLLVCVCVCVCV